MKTAAAALLFLSLFVSSHAKGTLISGPLLGYRAHREAIIWLETRGAETVTLEFQVRGQPRTLQKKTVSAPAPTPAGTQPIKVVLPLLEMGQRYTYAVLIDDQRQTFPYPLEFQTTQQWEWRSPPPDFSFLFGTCAYVNDAPYDRPGTPYGRSREIFQVMTRSGADFMIWGGDNTYLREADFSSESGIWYRYSHDRSTPELQRLLAVMNHYASWDDHDFGSNDSNRSFEFKTTTIAAFRAYWPNATSGEPDNPGIYHKFFWGDAAFILLDNRTHRDDTLWDQNLKHEKTQFGLRQIDWLKNSLLQAQQLGHYPFKFIVMGGQFLTRFDDNKETAAHFQRERDDLLRFLVDHRIDGVIFLTGDVHFSELARLPLPNQQVVYELTSSPLTSGTSASALRSRAADPQRVDGTFVNEQNFTQLQISGSKGHRRLTIRCVDGAGVTRWERPIEEAELKSR